MLIIYNLFVTLYYFAVRLAAIGNNKAKDWVLGRNNWAEALRNQIDSNSQWIWVHCASAGEFEQGKPVIEQLKQSYPQYKVLVSFSPSGYRAGKKYKLADQICYLPLDTRKNAMLFFTIVNPKLVVFVKYDYWYHHLKVIADNKCPLLLISAIFRESQPFFKWYGGLHRKMLGFFSQLFVQDLSSKERLETIHFKHCTVSGDTRFDRVEVIASQFSELPLIKTFTGTHQVLVAGSTWPEDEEMIKSALSNQTSLKLIIASHEISKAHIANLLKLFPSAITYSQIENKMDPNAQVLIIDNVGVLSRLYYYATITYIGGGFNKSGIHNTLEAAVWGKPVLFGPNYQKFKEARDLIERKAAFSVSDAEGLREKLQSLLEDNDALKLSSPSAQAYVQEQKGATRTILHYIQEKRLLTN